MTDPRNFATNVAYDLAGRLSTVTDAVSNVTTFGYDNADRLTSRTDPRSNAVSYGYDNANRLTSVTDRNGRQITYTYDNDNRLTAENWLNGQGQPIRTISYSYDSAGRLTGITDPDATYALGYDGYDRLSSVNNTGTPNVPQTTLTYTYDIRDNRTQLADNRDGSIAYTYDNADRMTSAELAVSTVWDASARVDFGYDNANRLTSLSRTNPSSGGSGGGDPVPVDSTLTYDDANRLTGLTHTANYTNLAAYTLGYDNANQLTSEASNDGTVSYGYDSGGQLTSATGWRSESYTYDGVGNRTMSGYSTGTGNRLLSDGSFNYTYDNEGNLLTKTEISTGKVTEYTWDYRNRLTNVKLKNSGGTVIQEQNYRYDPLDRRIGVGSDPDGAGPQPSTWQWTVYDGINPYADFDNSGSLTNRYLYGPAADQLFARFGASGTIGWYLTDQLGSVRDIADQSGTVVDHIMYDSFGKVISESQPSNGDRFKFTGREYDPNTGQYNYRARYYDAAIGRFTSEDPIGLAAGDTNVFRYVANAPTNSVDPTGALAGPPNMDATTPEYQAWYRQFMASTVGISGGGGGGGGGGVWSSIVDWGQYLGGSIIHPINSLYTGDPWADPASYQAAMAAAGEYWATHGLGVNVSLNAGIVTPGGGFSTGGPGVQLIFYPGLWELDAYTYWTSPALAAGWGPTLLSGGVQVDGVLVSNINSPSEYAGEFLAADVSTAVPLAGPHWQHAIAPNGVTSTSVGVNLGSPGMTVIPIEYQYYSEPFLSIPMPFDPAP